MSESKKEYMNPRGSDVPIAEWTPHDWHRLRFLQVGNEVQLLELAEAHVDSLRLATCEERKALVNRLFDPNLLWWARGLESPPVGGRYDPIKRGDVEALELSEYTLGGENFISYVVELEKVALREERIASHVCSHRLSRAKDWDLTGWESQFFCERVCAGCRAAARVSIARTLAFSLEERGRAAADFDQTRGLKEVLPDAHPDAGGGELPRVEREEIVTFSDMQRLSGAPANTIRDHKEDPDLFPVLPRRFSTAQHKVVWGIRKEEAGFITDDPKRWARRL